MSNQHTKKAKKPDSKAWKVALVHQRLKQHSIPSAERERIFDLNVSAAELPDLPIVAAARQRIKDIRAETE